MSLPATEIPERPPVCPKCGSKKLAKQMSRFTAISAATKPADGSPTDDSTLDEPRMLQAMSELERDMGHLDENNPRHMAHMIKKMTAMMPPGTVPQELDVAIKRLESGEDPEKIEADMGPILEQAFGGGGDDDEEEGSVGGSFGRGYTRDTGLYDY